MPSVKYKAKVLVDGHLSCPDSVKKKLHLEKGSEVEVIMEIWGKGVPFVKGKGLISKEGTGLCGIWEDDRNAEEIVRDIYLNRTGFKEVSL